MSKQQLYINGNVVDMPREEIKINVPSNIMSDAGSIMTAHSYSISLPRTMTNDAVLGNSFVPAADTGGKYTHNYLKTSLCIDGVPLFEDGKCVVDGVDDKGYKCNLYWGLLGIFDEIKEEGLDVCDLFSSERMANVEDTTSWLNMIDSDTGFPINPRLYVSGMNSDIYSTLDDNSKALARRLPWGLPIMTANEVLSAITTTYGITFNFSAGAASRISAINHAPTTLKCLGKEEMCVINMRTAWTYNGTNYYLGFMDGQADVCDYYYMPPTLYPTPSFAFHSASNKWQANNAIMTPRAGVDYLSANSKISIEKVRVWGYTSHPWRFEMGDIREDAVLSDGYYRMDYTTTDAVSFDKGDEILVVRSNEQGTSTTPTTINVQLYIREIDISDGCLSAGGNWWSYWRNMPQMGVVDYINELLAHIGGCCIGSVTKPASLRITTWDEIATNTSQTIDMEGLKAINMSFEKLAQRNNYTHKENKDNGLDYQGEGVTLTEDITLALSRDAFKSSFRVPQNVMVRLWKTEKDGDKYKASWVGGNDYIGGYDSGAGVFRNTGQDFANVILDYYTQYQAATRRPKVIECVVRLLLLDLMSFDFERLVYVPQLGRSYIVTKIESEGNDRYKITMLQM